MGICNPLTPDAYKYLVRIPLVSAFAFQWILANQGRLDLGDSVDYIKALVATRGANGAVIHAGTERLGQNAPFGKWHHISIEVDGELLYDATTDPRLEASEVQSTGNRSSLLKARITLDLGNGRQRDFDFDIGAGVEFDVACYAVSKLEVLIPDPRVAVPNDPPPVPPPAVALQSATVLTSTIYLATQQSHVAQPLTYTVPLIIANDPGAAFVPRVPDSVEVTGGTDEFIATAGGAIIDFLYRPGGLRQVEYATSPRAPASFFVLDQIALPAASTRFPRVLIPGNANAFRVRRTFLSLTS